MKKYYPDTKRMRDGKKGKRGVLSKKYVIIGVITLLAVLVLSAVLFLRPFLATVGEAYRPGVGTTPATANEVYFEHSTGFAARGDRVRIPLFINTNLVSPRANIIAIQICFKYPWDKFNVVSLEPSIANWARSSPSDAAAVPDYFAAAATEAESRVIGYRCPTGWTKGADFSVPPSSLTSAITGVSRFGEITFSVEAGAAYSIGGAEMIEVATVMVSGLNADRTDWQDEFIGASEVITSSTSINIVPACPDDDRDGFPPSLLFESFGGYTGEGDPKADYRACPSFEPTDASGVGMVDSGSIVPAWDCDDGNSAVYPGNMEICDNLDNDCNLLIDDGLSGAEENDEVRGVCTGRKICLGDGLINSYDVPEGRRGEIEGRTELQDYVSFLQGGEQVFSFNVYEGTGEISCDGLDNDCDGGIDEGLMECTLGTMASPNIGLIASVVPGNVFIDYDPGDDRSLSEGDSYLNPQTLTELDPFLATLIRTAPNFCGVSGISAPCESQLTDVLYVWFCKNNVYYLQEDGSSIIWKASALEPLSTVTEVPERC